MEEELRKFRHSDRLATVLKDAAKASGSLPTSNDPDIPLQLMQLICRLLRGLLQELATEVGGFRN